VPSNDSTTNTPELPFTITIPLTRGYVTVIDAVDADLADLKWHTLLAPDTCYVRRSKSVDGRRGVLFIHQVILARMLGRDLTKGERVDHINGDGLNNTRSNLRLATHTQNLRNARISRANTSGFKGVHWRKDIKKWQAYIYLDGKKILLGYFDTPELAYAAYCEAAEKLFGEFARFK
jgi:hypothetical protein